MAAMALEAHVHSEEGGPVIKLVGDVDGRAEQALDSAYSEAGTASGVMLDFSGVAYMNSTGIALIVGLLARARTNSQTLSVRGLTPHYPQIFEITRLADFMPMTSTKRRDQHDRSDPVDGCAPDRRDGLRSRHRGRHHQPSPRRH